MVLTEEKLDKTFAALADPTRRALVARLTTGEFSVNDLAEPFDMSVQAISKHLKVLEGAGLITRGQSAQSRPCRLDAEALEQATAWIDEQRRIWSSRIDRLEQHLENIQKSKTKPKH